MAETYCTPTPLSQIGIDMQKSSMYMGIATVGTSMYYTPTNWNIQDKIVTGLAAGAVAVIAANIVGWAAKSYLARCSSKA